MEALNAEINSIQKALNVLVVSGVGIRCLMILFNGQGDGKPVGQLLAGCRKTVQAGIIILTLPELAQVIRGCFLFPTPGNAAVGNSTLFYGMLMLLNATARLLAGLAAAWTATETIKNLVLYMKGNETTRQEDRNRLGKSLAAGVLMITGPGLVSALLGYFA